MKETITVKLSDVKDNPELSVFFADTIIQNTGGNSFYGNR